MSRRRGHGRPVGRLHADAPPSIDVARPLCVVLWNLYKGRIEGYDRELDRLARERGPDLFLLQETRPGLSTPSDFGGHHARSFRRAFAGEDEGVTTLARVAATSAVRVRSPQRELGLLTPKAALVSTFPLSDGRALTCVNVHGLNFDPTGRQLAVQLDELRGLVAPLDGPLLVGGDFNTWNERRMDATRELGEALGLTEVLPDFPGGKTGALPHERLERLMSLDRRLHLDRLFVRDLARLDAAWLDDYECSDHVPFCARLSFP